jgi:hypothetical protein
MLQKNIAVFNVFLGWQQAALPMAVFGDGIAIDRGWGH